MSGCQYKRLINKRCKQKAAGALEEKTWVKNKKLINCIDSLCFERGNTQSSSLPRVCLKLQHLRSSLLLKDTLNTNCMVNQKSTFPSMATEGFGRGAEHVLGIGYRILNKGLGWLYEEWIQFHGCITLHRVIVCMFGWFLSMIRHW